MGRHGKSHLLGSFHPMRNVHEVKYHYFVVRWTGGRVAPKNGMCRFQVRQGPPEGWKGRKEPPLYARYVPHQKRVSPL